MIVTSSGDQDLHLLTFHQVLQPGKCSSLPGATLRVTLVEKYKEMQKNNGSALNAASYINVLKTDLNT